MTLKIKRRRRSREEGDCVKGLVQKKGKERKGKRSLRLWLVICSRRGFEFLCLQSLELELLLEGSPLAVQTDQHPRPIDVHHGEERSEHVDGETGDERLLEESFTVVVEMVPDVRGNGNAEDDVGPKTETLIKVKETCVFEVECLEIPMQIARQYRQFREPHHARNECETLIRLGSHQRRQNSDRASDDQRDGINKRL